MNIDKKYYSQIQENLKNTLQDTKMNAPNKKVGKVRDAYFLENQVLMRLEIIEKNEVIILKQKRL